jgi:hypothetical protein
MEDRAHKPDAIDQADFMFRDPPTLDELVADLEPLRPEESFDIPDLSDEAWVGFVAALRE